MTTRGSRGGEIFRDGLDRSLFLHLLERFRARFEWSCSAYCLMTTHYHVVVRLREANLATGMAALNGRYARAFNERYELRGHAFGARYFAGQLETDGHFLEAHRYIALNPVRAGLVDRPEEWPWSSYGFSIGERDVRESVVGTVDVFDAVQGGARRMLEGFVEDALADTVSSSPVRCLAPDRAAVA